MPEFIWFESRFWNNMHSKTDVLVCALISRGASGMYNNMHHTARTLAENGFTLIKNHTWDKAVCEYVEYLKKEEV